jgi:hypothetical protein
MAYEIKTLLASMAQIVAKAETVEEVYIALSNIANVEGVILEPYEALKRQLNSPNEKKRRQDGD